MSFDAQTGLVEERRNNVNYLEIVGTILLGSLISIPVLLAWLVGIVLAILMLRQGGGKAEKLLLIGCSAMFVSQLGRPFLTGLAIWLTATRDITRVQAAFTTGLLRLPLAILDMAGIVCLLFAFWFRWRIKGTPPQQIPVSSHNQK